MFSVLHPSIEDMLPENVMCEVLSRLPVKTVIHCKCVCKKWRDLVSSLYFVHLQNSRSHPCLMFNRSQILELVEVEHQVDYDHHVTLNHVKSLNLCFNARFQIKQVGSVNGLICLCHQYAGYIINPVVDEYMILPKPRLNHVLLSYGFGVSVAGEYKVIRICGTRVSKKELYAVEIEVYTLGTNQWRNLGQTEYYLKVTTDVGSGVFVNSHVYWIADGQIYDFDLNIETFELFPSPPGPKESKQMLGVLEGNLNHFSWSSFGFTVWMMKEESWYNAITIQEKINSVFESYEVWTPLCLFDDSKGTSILIFSTGPTSRTVAYYLNTNTIQHLNLPDSYFISRVMGYRPSFLKLQNFGSTVHSLYTAKDTVKKYRSC